MNFIDSLLGGLDMSKKNTEIFIISFEGAKIDNLTLSLDRETLKQLPHQFPGTAAPAGEEQPENEPPSANSPL